MTLKQAHKEKVPFYLSGKFYDYISGMEYFNHRNWAGPYSGPCLVGPDLFETWIDGEGERCWRVLVLSH